MAIDDYCNEIRPALHTGETMSPNHPAYGRPHVYVDRPIYTTDPNREKLIAQLQRENAGLKQEVFRLRQETQRRRK